MKNQATGAANTFNNIERVYSRAIAFASRSVRVHAPNIICMYSELFYTYSIHLNDRSLAPPSPEVLYAAPCFRVPLGGVHLHTWGVGTLIFHVVSR